MTKKPPKVRYNVYPFPIYHCPDCDCGLTWSGEWRCKFCPECGCGIDWTGFPPEKFPEWPTFNGPYDWRRIDKWNHEGRDFLKTCGADPYTGELTEIAKEANRRRK